MAHGDPSDLSPRAGGSLDIPTRPSEPAVHAGVQGVAARAVTGALTALLAGIALAAALVLAAGLWKNPSLFALASIALWLLAMVCGLQAARDPRKGWPVLASVAVLSLLIRAWSVALASGVALGADPMNYTNLAQALIEGRGLTVDDWRYGQDLRAYFPPLYPILLAGWWMLFSDSAWSTLAMNTAIDLAAAWALRDTARRLGGSRSQGNWVALAWLAYPAFALSAGIPQKESLTLLFVALLLRGTVAWMAEDAAGARRWRHGLGLGLWWGALALTQPSLAVAPLAIAVVLVWQRGFAPALRLGLTALPMLIAVLLPWWIRNWLLLGHFVPFTTASGFMHNVSLHDRAVPFPDGLFDMPEHQRSAVIGQLARERIAEAPLPYAKDVLHAQAIGFAYEEAPLARFRHTTPAITAADHARLAPLLQFGWLALVGSALAAAWRQVRLRHAEPITCFCLALFLAIGATNVWFEFGERHRYVLSPFLMLIACGFWWRSVDKAE